MKKPLITCLMITLLLNLSINTGFAQKYRIKASHKIINNKLQNIISESNFTITVIDPNEKTNPGAKHYPGFRGNNQLIIYTSKYGVKTGTNEYGQEAVVSNGTVVKAGGADSFIPVNGYVISGHGTAKKWINQNIQIGSKVSINYAKRQLKVYLTPESFNFKAIQKIQEVKGLLNINKRKNKNYQATKAISLIKKAEQLLKQSHKYIKDKRYKEAQQLANQATTYAQAALYYVVPAKEGEFKGVWIRPTEKTPEQIAKTVKLIKKIGINNIFLETYYQSYTIYPSKFLASKGVKEQRDEFKGWDPLAVWLKEAHKNNIKLHAWFQTFYTGNDNPAYVSKHILSVHPDWANVQKRNYAAKKPMPSLSEHNGYFLDPANPEVQLYLFTLLKEIATQYKVDGINIDYIRYPASLSSGFTNHVDSSWGYTEYARQEFKQKYKVDPIALKQGSANWKKWIEYRQDKITEFVKLLCDIKNDNSILLSAVIFPHAEESSIIKLQDWKTWANKGYFNAFTPLIMSSDKRLAHEYTNKVKKESVWGVKVFPGLFEPFIQSTPSALLNQIVAIREEGAQGVVIFDYAHLNKEFRKSLSSRVFK